MALRAGSALGLDYSDLLGAGYDANGNLMTRTDTLAAVTDNFTYDALDRLDTAVGAFGDRDYDYDPNGNRTQLIAASQTTAYAYDPASNRLSAIDTTPVSLDANGNTTAQGTRTFTYTAHNRLSTVTDTGLTASYTYNGLGQRVAKTAGGATTRFVYGLSGELLAELDTSGAVQAEYVYLDGQPLAYLTPGTPGPFTPVEFAIDDGDPATAPSGTWTSYPTPEAFGGSLEYATGATGATYRFTPSAAPGFSAGTWEVYGRWVAVPDNASAVPYTIAASGATTTVSADQTQNNQAWVLLGTFTFTNDGTEYIELSDATGQTLADAVGLRKIAAPPPPATVYYLHNDHLGTPWTLTDAQGTVVWSAAYDPFGQATVDADPDGDGTPVTFNIRLPGQYYDQETGLHYNYFRYYDPRIGRYITSDPIGIVPGVSPAPMLPTVLRDRLQSLPISEILMRGLNHPYSYVDENPLRYSDPQGLFPWWFIPAGVLLYEAGSLVYDYFEFIECVEQCPTACEDGNTAPNLKCKAECSLRTWAKPNGPGPWWPLSR